MSTGQSHWFDRFAAKRTRREALKVAAAGAALALPGLRAAPARAGDPSTDCRVGCGWTAHQVAESSLSTCGTLHVTLGAGTAYLGTILSAGLGGVVFAIKYHNDVQALAQCDASALTRQKADLYDCQQPFCSGFDPKQPGGPCDTCTGYCCVDPTVVAGYSCCALGCACAGNAGACRGSTTC